MLLWRYSINLGKGTKLKESELIAKLVLAGLSGDQHGLRSLALKAVRSLKAEHPSQAQTISDAITQMNAGASPLRAVGIEPPPKDRETGLGLVRVIAEPSAEPLVLNPALEKKVSHFLKEYLSSHKLLSSGLLPPTSLLLLGEPGVGKTHLAEYIAAKTGKTLLVLDLAASVSSLLGKTGQNLRAVLDYARSSGSVLFLDEFDSIAKRRDDPADLGELKRIVNILLKELETWPPNGILIAATNHADLLDKAIWRRFDEVIEIPIPGINERRRLIERGINHDLGKSIAELAASLTEELSAADIIRICERVNRRLALESVDVNRVLFEELFAIPKNRSKKTKADICRIAHELIPDLTLEQIAEWVDLSASTVHYHIKGKVNEPRA